MYCAHVGDYQQEPPTEMEQLCPHVQRCPTCGFSWECVFCPAGRDVPKLNPKLEAELAELLENGNGD